MVWLYADQFSIGSDIGAQINAAIAALPLIGGLSAGVVSLEAFSGTMNLSTEVVISSPYISIVGPGKHLLTIQSSVNGDTFFVAQNPFSTTPSGVLSGFSVAGTGTANGVGIRIRDMFCMRLHDIGIYHFTGTNGVGLIFENLNNGFTEQIDCTNLIISNNTTGIQYLNSDTTLGQGASFGYGNYDVVFIQTGSGQTGVHLVRPTGVNSQHAPLLYHSNINWIFEGLVTGQTADTYLVIDENGNMIDNTYSIMIEDQVSAGGTMFSIGANAILTGFGHIESFGTSKTMTLGSGAIVNIGGKIELPGVTSHRIPASVFALSGGWGNTASLTAVSGHWQMFTFTVTVPAGATGIAANPTIQINFQNTGSPNYNGVWRDAPQVSCKQVAGSPVAFVTGENTATSQHVILQFNGTPVANSTYVFTCQMSAQ